MFVLRPHQIQAVSNPKEPPLKKLTINQARTHNNSCGLKSSLGYEKTIGFCDYSGVVLSGCSHGSGMISSASGSSTMTYGMGSVLARRPTT